MWKVLILGVLLASAAAPATAQAVPLSRAARLEHVRLESVPFWHEHGIHAYRALDRPSVVYARFVFFSREGTVSKPANWLTFDQLELSNPAENERFVPHFAWVAVPRAAVHRVQDLLDMTPSLVDLMPDEDPGFTPPPNPAPPQTCGWVACPTNGNCDNPSSWGCIKCCYH